PFAAEAIDRSRLVERLAVAIDDDDGWPGAVVEQAGRQRPDTQPDGGQAGHGHSSCQGRAPPSSCRAATRCDGPGESSAECAHRTSIVDGSVRPFTSGAYIDRKSVV